MIVAAPPAITEVSMNTYDAAIEAAGDRLAVLDMYTQWWVGPTCVPVSNPLTMQ